MSSSEDADDLLLACACAITTKLLAKKKQRKKRRWWMRSLYRNRELYSGSMLLNDLKNEDGDHFKNCCRMTPETFNNLLNLIETKIRKEDTQFRLSIPANERLALTLRYLATGDSFASLSLLFKVSKSSISSIVPEVCTAIIEELQDYIKVNIFSYIFLAYKYIS